MFELDSFFPYLVNSVTTRIAGNFHRKVKAFGITIEKWRVLSALLARDAQSVSELARSTDIEISTLSHLLTRMAREGLVTRRRSGRDGRVVTVALTARARRIALRILPLVVRHETVALKGFSARERKALKAMLGRVRANLDDIDEETEPARPARRRPVRSRPAGEASR